MSTTGPASTMRPAYITCTRVGEAGDDAEVVGDEHDRRCSRVRADAREQLEDLRLHGHVERGRRLVGDQDVGVVGQRPSRSSPAGACRPTARGDRTLAPVGRRRGTTPSRAARPPWPRPGCGLTCWWVMHRLGDLAADRRAPGSATSSDPGRSSRCGRRECSRSTDGAAPSSSVPSKRTEPLAVGVDIEQPEHGQHR